ncbi:MAG: ATP-binding cassette domain-containing protein [Corynebacterium sp.]|nr:ATP-binding cassette domain-containing protein [Corynebacterium sp.]
MVRTHDLTKTYDDHTVVNNVNLEVPTGSIYGFLGPNGSGKSTTMKMLLNLVQPTSGSIEIGGQEMNRSSRQAILKSVGSLIENPPGYGHLTGAKNMQVMQSMLGLSDEAVQHAINTVRLHDQMDKKVSNYSLGMKQRLGIALALAKNPSLLVLDEPTNGLDPAGIEEIRELLITLAGCGVTIIVSSHLLSEVDKVATHLGILSSGTLLFQGTREELFSAATPDVLIRCSDAYQAYSLLTRATAHEHTITALSPVDRSPANYGQIIRIRNSGDNATAHTISTLVNACIDVYDVRREEQHLEDLFMDLTHEGAL